MSKDPQLLLQFILESIENLEEYTQSMDAIMYAANMEKQDAVERRLQMIGQAIIQLPQKLKEENPEIEWAEVAGLRNRLVHEYLEIDHGLIWNIIEKSLPEFKKAIQELVKDRKA